MNDNPNVFLVSECSYTQLRITDVDSLHKFISNTYNYEFIVINLVERF